MSRMCLIILLNFCDIKDCHTMLNCLPIDALCVIFNYFQSIF